MKRILYTLLIFLLFADFSFSQDIGERMLISIKTIRSKTDSIKLVKAKTKAEKLEKKATKKATKKAERAKKKVVKLRAKLDAKKKESERRFLYKRNLILTFENSYLISNGSDTLEVSVIETETYIKGNVPQLKVIIDKTDTVKTNKIERPVELVTKSPYSVLLGAPNYISEKIVKTTFTGDTSSIFSKKIFDINSKKIKKCGKQKSYINSIYQYGQKTVNNFYIFVNFSPSYSYRRLVSTEPYAAEYYNQAYLAEQKDKGMTFPTLNNDAKTSYQYYKNANFGFGFSMGTGHSFFASYNQFQKGYFLYYGKNDTVFKHQIINNSGIFIGYRYQRIHRYKAIMPLVEASYGWISGTKNDVYKLAAGFSTMLWSKNFYLNVVPFYEGGFSSTDGITGIKGINPRIYNVGIDVGLVYKIWFF